MVKTKSKGKAEGKRRENNNDDEENDLSESH